MSALPFDRTPFEHSVAGMLGTAAASAAPPAAMAAAIKARAEGAPQVLAALATVNTIAAPAAMRARVASGVGAGAAAAAAMGVVAAAPKPRLSQLGVQQLPLVAGVVAAVAAVVGTLVYVATSDGDSSPVATTVPAMTASDGGSGTGGADGSGGSGRYPVDPVVPGPDPVARRRS